MRRLSLLSTVLALWAASPAAAGDVTVFAAASLGDVLTEAGTLWEAESGHRISLSAAGSSQLARQISQGAPADLFISANPEWMDWLDARMLIRPDTRRVLMGNALVLVAPAREADPDAAPSPGASPAAEAIRSAVATDLGAEGRLAMALIDAVPAGLYGRQAFEALGLWGDLAPRIAQTDNVRAALRLVALGEAPLGVVYATDAAAEPRVRTIAPFPEDSHDPILYPAAVTRDAAAPDLAQAFLDWLGGAGAQALLARHGFVPPPE